MPWTYDIIDHGEQVVQSYHTEPGHNLSISSDDLPRLILSLALAIRLLNVALKVGDPWFGVYFLRSGRAPDAQQYSDGLTGSYHDSCSIRWNHKQINVTVIKYCMNKRHIQLTTTENDNAGSLRKYIKVIVASFRRIGWASESATCFYRWQLVSNEGTEKAIFIQ